MSERCRLVWFASIVLGCGSNHGPAAGNDAPTVDSQPADSPVILSLTSTVSRLTMGDVVTVVAVVTEPTGLENLVGGKLTSADGTLTYGAFVATTQGTYNLPLSWDQIAAVSPLDFAGDMPLTLRATFFNKIGAQSSQNLQPIDLFCGTATPLDNACASTCVRFDSIAHCGGCDVACQAESSSQLTGITAVSCPQATFCDFQGKLDALAFPNLTCTNACSGSTPAAACATASATMMDGTTRALDCITSFDNFMPTTTETLTAQIVTCSCMNGAQFLHKNSLGSCASLCPATLPCTATIAQGNGFTLLDRCSGPYLYDNWDNVANAVGNGSFPITVNVLPTTLACGCEGAPLPH